MGSCPANYQRINNGCYNFTENANIDWKTASSICKNLTDSTPANEYKTHLIAFESLAETIAINFWMRGIYKIGF